MDDELPGTSIRQLKTKPAVVWYGDVLVTGVRGMQTPGRNKGPLIRMYHPRLGLWIVQQIWEEALSFFPPDGKFGDDAEDSWLLTTTWSTISSSDKNRS